MKRRAISALLAASLLLGTLGAHAEESAAAQGSDNRAVAETLFFTARGLMEAGRYAEACVKLSESYRLDPAAGTLLNLAVCHEKEGRIASAWGEFHQALADAKRMNRPDREKLANERIAILEPDLPKLIIEVPSAVQVPGLEVRRNGVKLEAAAWAVELPVDPGQVEIVASAPGYKPRKKTVTLEKRGRASVSIDALEIMPEAIVYWTGKRKTALVLGGLGLAAIGVGTYFGLNTISQRSKSDAECPVFDGERRCSSAGVDAMSKAKTSAWIADVSIGVGAVMIVTGAYLLITGGSSIPEASKTASAADVRWGLTATSTGAYGTIARAF